MRQRSFDFSKRSAERLSKRLDPSTLKCVRASVVVGATVLAVAAFAAPAFGGGWLPHAADATWTYQWTDSVYDTTPTNEKVTVKSATGNSFVLAWTTKDAGTPDAPQSDGTVAFQDTNFGIVNTDWTSSPPPTAFPILCGSLSQCGNSLASSMYEQDVVSVRNLGEVRAQLGDVDSQIQRAITDQSEKNRATYPAAAEQDAATMEAVAARKQALRDVTADPAIEAARTPEELKGVWPEVLR